MAVTRPHGSPSDTNGLLNGSLVAQQLAISHSTLRRLRAAGVLPAVRVGRQWRFRATDIQRVLGGEHVVYPTQCEGPDMQVRAFDSAGAGDGDDER